MKKFIVFLSFISLVFVSCKCPEYTVDLKLKREIFNECLKNIPVGPQRTVANDWDEVIVECRRTANELSWVCVKNCE